MTKYITLITILLVSACSQSNIYLSECEKWPLSAHCEDKATHVAENEVGPVDPSPSDPGGYEENEEEEYHPKHNNNGHGNGDEGDCKGRGCSDSDNPGKKK